MVVMVGQCINCSENVVVMQHSNVFPWGILQHRLTIQHWDTTDMEIRGESGILLYKNHFA